VTRAALPAGRPPAFRQRWAWHDDEPVLVARPVGCAHKNMAAITFLWWPDRVIQRFAGTGSTHHEDAAEATGPSTDASGDAPRRATDTRRCPETPFPRKTDVFVGEEVTFGDDQRQPSTECPCATARKASDRPSGERGYPLIGVAALGGRSLGPERRASIVLGEAGAHEGQAALGHLGIEVAGRPSEGRGEVPGVHGELGALPVEWDGAARRRVVGHSAKQVLGMRAEPGGGFTTGRGGRRPVNRLATRHPSEPRRGSDDVVDQVLDAPLRAWSGIIQRSAGHVVQQTSQLVQSAAQDRRIVVGRHDPNASCAQPSAVHSAGGLRIRSTRP
jgi:hypothetical protein